MSVKVDKNKCSGCGLCVEICPVGAITIDEVAKIDTEICTGCCACMNECPNDAIFVDRKGAAPSFRGNTSPLHKPLAQSAKPLSAYQNFGQQSDFKTVERSGGILEQVFDFLGRATHSGRGQRCGQGQGGGGGRGRGGVRDGRGRRS